MTIPEIDKELRTLAAKHPATCCGGNRRQPMVNYPIGHASDATMFVAQTLQHEGHYVTIADDILYLKARCKDAQRILANWFNRYLQANEPRG